MPTYEMGRTWEAYGVHAISEKAMLLGRNNDRNVGIEMGWNGKGSDPSTGITMNCIWIYAKTSKIQKSLREWATNQRISRNIVSALEIVSSI